MRYLELSEENLTPAARYTADILIEKGIVVIPTETQYGLSCCYDDINSIYRINRIKGRPEKTPQIVLLRFEWVANWLDERYMPLAEALWPGPFSILVPTALENPFNSEKFCFRVSSHPFIESLLEILGKPITSTSANRSEQKPLRYEKELKETFSDHVELIVHDRDDFPWSRRMKRNPPSTMVDATDFPKSVTVLRKGTSDLSELDRVFPGLVVKYV